MADAAVEFLLDNLKQLLVYHIDLIGDAKSQVENLEKDLRLFKAFLNDSIKKRRKDQRVQELVRQIRDVVYSAEDVVDAFVTQAAESKSKSYFRRAFSTMVDLHSIGRDVQIIGSQVRKIYGDDGKIGFAALNIADDESDKPEVPVVRQKNVVGFDDEAKTIIGYLIEETEKLDVITIIGMPGLGKTTLAGKIFHDPAIEYEFPTRIWLYISQEFSKRTLFLQILKHFTTLTEDIDSKDEQELAKLVATELESGKFLIVMDDVWTAVDWKKLEIALPDNNKMGKVLVTSRNEEVALCANHNRPPHNLRFLTDDESWELLQLEVFGKLECPSDLDVVGKLIAINCRGLPLAIVVIGGILTTKFLAAQDTNARARAWEKVSQNVKGHLNEDQEKRMDKIIFLSYNKLPFHLRACFLYFGMFPEDYEIPAWKLIRMWIGEGFIQQKDGYTLEETAESYLEDLISRNLVRTEMMKPDGRVKTCRIHDMLRDFCKNEAGDEKENFFQEMKSNNGVIDPPIGNVKKFRRLSIHSQFLNFINSKPYGPHVRSFVCFSKDEINLPPENSSAIPAAFKLLRVLDVKPIKFSKIPKDMYELVHLRYIALTFNLAILPKVLDKLWNIQTLIVDTTSRTLDVRADIWKMNQLRHLKTNVSATLPKPTKSSKHGEQLQTLGTIAVENCTEQVFDKARNVKKLSIRGPLALLLDGKSGYSFDSLGKLSSLEKLKLLNDVFPHPPSEGQLRGLPQPYKFPPNLRSLTISATFLSWNHMSIIGLLYKLEVLKLKNNAFKGDHWVAADGGFRLLEVLHIEHTDLAVWKAEGHHFPKLRRLELHNCEALCEVPIGLAEIPSLQLLDLYRTTRAAASAKKILDAKQASKESSKDCNFKLTVFPPLDP